MWPESVEGEGCFPQAEAVHITFKGIRRIKNIINLRVLDKNGAAPTEA